MGLLEPSIIDGDPGWTKVDTFRPANELEPGVAAEAVNKRFEDGRAWPRFNVNAEPWGALPVLSGELVPAGARYDGSGHFGVKLEPDALYWLTLSDLDMFAKDGSQVLGSIRNHGPFLFQAQTALLQLTEAMRVGGLVGASLKAAGRPRGFARFNDPDGFDNLVVAIDEWRTAAGEDGGRGRAWRLVSGNAPQAIPLNGHDIYGEARLVSCYNGLELLRQDNERHYFQAAALNGATNQIQLNCLPNWQSGDLVFFHASADGEVLGTTPPNPETLYYVKNIAGNKVELYRDPGLSAKLTFDGGARGWFYLERRSAQPGYGGNGAPPLLMQADGSGKSAWENGFLSVPPSVAAAAWDGATKIVSAPNHRLVPGQEVVYTHVTGETQQFWVDVVNEHAVRLYQSDLKALGGGVANAQTPAPAWASGDLLEPKNASKAPMPPGREGLWLPIGRLVVANGNNLAISDPLDPLHFAPYQASVTANLGEADDVTSMVSMTKDRFVIGKDNELLLFDGISQPNTSWQVTELTREYGWIAPLASVAVGKDAWGLSRKGVVSVVLTAQGELQGLADPVSRPMKKYLEQVDWKYASQACAAVWNNRYFLALPLKGQDPTKGPIKNNGVLVYNILNQGWEGMWQGDLLQIYCFARHLVYGEERLCFVNYAGQVCFLGDGWTDAAAPINDLLVTRTYTAGTMDPKLWLIADTVWDTNNPKLTVTARAPGYNENQVLLQDKTYDPTKHLVYGQPDYDPATGNFDEPNREDYSLSAAELTKGALDVHQNVPERLRLRMNDWGVQIAIANSQGSARVQSVTVRGMPTLKLASRRS